jgi:hypothetical protein
MMKGLKFAVVSAIFLFPCTYARSAFSWGALTYQEAVRMCQMGSPWGCEVMNAYRRPSGSPADGWVRPGEVQRERRGPLSTYDFIR